MMRWEKKKTNPLPPPTDAQKKKKMDSHTHKELIYIVTNISSQSSFLPVKKRGKKKSETKFASGYCKVIEAINSTLRTGLNLSSFCAQNSMNIVETGGRNDMREQTPLEKKRKKKKGEKYKKKKERQVFECASCAVL